MRLSVVIATLLTITVVRATALYCFGMKMVNNFTNLISFSNSIGLGNFISLDNSIALGNPISFSNSITLGNPHNLTNFISLGNPIGLGEPHNLNNFINLSSPHSLGNFIRQTFHVPTAPSSVHSEARVTSTARTRP
ncbi:hypothetical protein XA68_17887 [Ophiocordyceps unilateralis]|uniref:Heme haloperoxidase family profile domain-containing protein n=1 Tax=Ophiocordyceps unilateralis TaxID=268505 RepID=A0A2A9PK39_OPHUN|nr:hypothetical protein XA68_17887 [Ophiocordyceps unilateralis]